MEIREIGAFHQQGKESQMPHRIHGPIWCLLAIAVAIPMWIAAEDAPSKAPVPALADIPVNELQTGKRRIIGLLGVPLGQIVVADVVFRMQPMGIRKAEPRPVPVVTAIDGVALKDPITFNEYFAVPTGKIPLADGTHGRFVVFETIRFRGTPDDAWEDRRSPVAEVYPFGIYNELTLVRPAGPMK